MVARVSTYEGDADRLDELAEGFEQSSDAVRELDGFEGAYLLVDRTTGEALTVALWSSPEAAEASAERVKQLRSEAAEASAHSIESVNVYDVPARIEAG
jgi:heme-degrading monooxygenase HmoA